MMRSLSSLLQATACVILLFDTNDCSKDHENGTIIKSSEDNVILNFLHNNENYMAKFSLSFSPADYHLFFVSLSRIRGSDLPLQQTRVQTNYVELSSLAPELQN